MQGLQDLLQDVSESLAYVVPEITLTFGILLLLTGGLFAREHHWFFRLIAGTVAIASLTIVAFNGLQTRQSLFNDMLRRDGLTDFLMLLVDAGAVLTCVMSISSTVKKHASEYYALILAVALGCHLLLMSSNLVMVFLSLEVISISSYVLAGYSFDKVGSEGTLKYFIFGSVASAFMLYGFTILYGLTGTLLITDEMFFQRLMDNQSGLVLVAGLMSLSGFLFKMAAVPMQLWAPDIYEAAPTPVVAFLSVVPKVAAIGILVKFLLALNLFGQGSFDWQTIIGVIAILTIIFGNLSALRQTNPKRMMAYSSIAQSGFLLVGITAFTEEGLRFTLFYAAVYLLMNFAVFSYLMYFERNGVHTIPGYAGKGHGFVWAMVGITVGMIALTGLPPTAGFTAKLLIFSSLWEAYQETDKSLLFWLLVIGLLNTVVSLFYYLRIPYFAFIHPAENTVAEKRGRIQNLLGFLLVVLVVLGFFIPGLLIGLINRINFVP